LCIIASLSAICAIHYRCLSRG
jgi:hypothetical protein